MSAGTTTLDNPSAGDSSQEPLPARNESRSLRRMATSGAAWTVAAHAASLLLRLGSNLILTRLLAPEYFGVMALIQVVIEGMAMFSDLGVEASVVQHQFAEDADFLNTAWIIRFIRGLVFFALICLAAYPAAQLYGEPELSWLLPFVGLSAIFAGASSPSLLLMRRRLQVSKLVALELSTQVVSTLVVICLAWWFRSIWALACGSLVQKSLLCVLSHSVAEDRIGLRWCSTHARQMLRFGRWIAIGSALTFLLQKGDQAILGVLVPTETLGLFAIASIWARLPVQLLLQLNSRVLFPLYSEFSRRKGIGLRSNVFRVRWRLAVAFIPLCWGLMIGGKYLISVLYDARYVDAGWMLELLAFGAIASVVRASSGGVLLAVGDSFRFMLLQISSAIALIIGMTIGYQLDGVSGMILGIAVSRYLDYPILAWAIRRYEVWFPALDLAIALSTCVIILCSRNLL
ncbi:oligosaccharide flippase family protein [Aeoliella sp.]|uniref:oligosaccharide flippase family protein n=1 Tax=Aeoliella sp. TaxID=2795800 RepID=UPI003CCBF0C1